MAIRTKQRQIRQFGAPSAGPTERIDVVNFEHRQAKLSDGGGGLQLATIATNTIVRTSIFQDTLPEFGVTLLSSMQDRD